MSALVIWAWHWIVGGMVDKRISAELDFEVTGEEAAADLADGLNKVEAASKGVSAAGANMGEHAGAINNAEAATGRFAKTTEWLREKWQQTAGTVRDFAIGNVVAQVFMNIAGRATDMARAFIESNVQMEGLRRALTAIYKDASLASEQITFLRKTSSEAGVGFAGLSDSFKSFTAAATAANIPLAVQNDLFSTVARAGATLGLSTAETSRAMLALSQMASKGVVSMEELRGQLGESLPGALSLAAQGLGLTEAELIKLVESGGLAARDLFPALARAMKSMTGENDTLVGGWERLKNAISQAFVAVGDGGGMQVLSGGLRVLAGLLGIVAVPLQGFMEALFALGRTLGAVAASFAILTDSSLSWSQKAAALKDVGSELSDSFAAAGGRIKSTAGAFKDAALGAEEGAAGIGKLKDAADQSTAAAAQLSQSWVAIGQSMNKAAADAANAAINSAKHAEAVKLEGDVLVELAKVRGDANLVADAETTAAANNATALQAVATARSQQLEILQAELTAKQNLIAGDADEQKARAQALRELTDKIEKLGAEAEASKAAAAASLVDADAKRRAAAANRDHSGQIKELIERIERQKQVVQDLERLNLQGKATDERVATAKRELGDAYALLNDALKDNVVNQNAAVAAAQTDAQTTRTLLEADMERAKVAEQRARQMGDEYGVRRALIQQKEIEIKILQAEIHANEMLAIAKIAALNADREQLIASGKITEAKSLEIDAAIRAAQAQIMLSKARGESVKLMEEELNKIRMGVSGIGEYERSTKSAANTTREATASMGKGWQGVAGNIGNAQQKAEEYAKFQQYLQDKYGRPGESAGQKKAEADRDRKKQEQDDAFMASRFAQGWAKDGEGKVISAVESEAQMNQRIAKLFGDGAIGMKEAIDAANIKIKLDEADQYGVANLPGNGEYYANLRKEFARLSALVIASGKSGNGTAVGRPAQADKANAPKSSGTSSGGGSGISTGSGNGSGGGNQYVTYLTVDGTQRRADFKDAKSQSSVDDFLRQAVDAQRRAA